MNLRRRIGWIVVGFVAIIVAGLLLANQVREGLLRQERESVAILQSQGLWDMIVENGLQRIERHQSEVTNNEELRVAFETEDRDRLVRVAVVMLERLKIGGDINRLDLVDAEGQVIFSSVAALESKAPVRPRLIQRLLAERMIGSGIGNDASRNVTLSLVLPFYASGDNGDVPLGAAIMSLGIHDALEDLQEASVAEALLINRRGRLLVGTEPDLWRVLRKSVQLSGPPSQNLQVGDRSFSVTLLPLRADLGNLVSTLVVARDVSASFSQRRRVAWISLGLVGTFLMLALFALSFYLNRALSPLTTGATILNSLSQGDISSVETIEIAEGNDELARIGRAINAFRSQTIAVRRQQRLRERRRRYQEGFIRAEMTRLADTLAGEVRDEVLSELSDIEMEMKNLLEEQDGEAAGEALSLQMTGLAFEKMTDRVAAQQKLLTELVADLQRALKTRRDLVALQRDLEIAARVQLSFLPGESYRAEGVAIEATMSPARDVGGDFYDFFDLDEHCIGVVVADVAGKGVPAALFMAVARTLIRALAVRFMKQPGACLEATNEMLVQSIREDIFVTVFYGVYDRRDGSFVYANGGHNAPILIVDGKVEMLPLTHGVLLAMFGGLKYAEATTHLPPGGKLFLYTDGVTESINSEEEEFGEDRMNEVLRKGAAAGPGDTLESMLLAVDQHAESAEQFDDITMMVLAHQPPEDRMVVARSTFRNDLGELARLAAEIEAFGERAEMEMADIARLQLALDEIVTNIINYAYPDGGRHQIDLRAAIENGVVEVRVEDQGQPFDPLRHAPPADLDGEIEERSIGGLGVHLVREVMDEVEYVRIGPRNRLILRKRVKISD